MAIRSVFVEVEELRFGKEGAVLSGFSDCFISWRWKSMNFIRVLLPCSGCCKSVLALTAVDKGESPRYSKPADLKSAIEM